MNEEQARAGRELRAAVDDFIAALRLAQGMNETALDRLKNAIIKLGVAWEAEDHLPKPVVNTLVGMFSWIDSASYLYTDNEALAIKRAAMDVETLIFQHVVPAS